MLTPPSATTLEEQDTIAGIQTENSPALRKRKGLQRAGEVLFKIMARHDIRSRKFGWSNILMRLKSYQTLKHCIFTDRILQLWKVITAAIIFYCSSRRL